MSDISIAVSNASAVEKNFFLFLAPPKINDDISGVFQTYFLKKTVGANGSITFSFKNDLYAVCGSSSVTKDSSIEQLSAWQTPVQLKKANQNVIQCYRADVTKNDGDKGQMSFAKTLDTPDNQPKDYPNGSFIIKTYQDFNQGDDVFIGLGKKNEKGVIVPVAVKTPSPSSEHIIQPVITFYVATGNFFAGKLVNIAIVGKTTTIDFTGKGKYSASLTYNSDGTYSEVSFDG